MIGINLLWCVPGVVGGTEEYAVRTTTSLLDHYAATSQASDVTLFVLEPFVDAHPELVERAQVAVAPIDGSSRPVRVFFETTWMRREVRDRGIRLMHHVGGTIPAVRPVPAILTLHDLQPLEIPRNFAPIKRTYLRFAIPRSVARAELIVTPSEFVRRQVLDRFGPAPDKVVAISAGYDLPRLPLYTDPVVPAPVRQLIEQDTPYFVYPAITHHHKDHATALRAVAEARTLGHDLRFVMTGGSGEADDDVGDLIESLDLESVVTRLGRIERTNLELLVAHAEALLFPSRFEGFGIPVLEAMALGCPVIAADATALPEVTGEAATLVSAGDVDAWTKAICDRIENRPDRETAVAAGRRQAANFAFRNAGERLAKVYSTALGARTELPEPA